MNDIYVLMSGMTKEQMFRLRLINGFNFAPIVTDAIIDLSKDFFQTEFGYIGGPDVVKLFVKKNC